MLHPDGSKYSDGFFKQSSTLPSIPPMMSARIDEILYTDNPKNSTLNSAKKEIEYNCTIIGGPYDGVRLFHVKDTTESGGQFNKGNHVRNPITKGSTSAPVNKIQDTNGEMVMIALVNGNTYSARIVKGIPNIKGTSQDIKSTDGINNSWDFNGVSFSVDKEGALSIKSGQGIDGASPSGASSEIKFGKDGDFSTETVPPGGVLGAITSAVVSAVDDVAKSAIASAKDSLNTIISQCTLDIAPNINIDDELNALTSARDNLDSITGMTMDDINGMADGLANAAANSIPGVAELRSLSSSISSLASGGLGFSLPIKFSLTKDGTSSMGNMLQNVNIDKLGQTAITGIGGMGQRFAMGGVSTTIAPFTNIISTGMTNIKSALTNIGTGGLPSAKMGDISIGVDSMGCPVISKLSTGSFISMVGA